MSGRKLSGRIEDARWDPPLLSFSIERHGATVLGSTRAELHRWTLDLEAIAASAEPSGYRQVRPAQRRLDVQPLAEEIFAAMRERLEDERLKWSSEEIVRVQIGKVIPEGSAAKQTVSGRRSRFRDALSQLVKRAGGETVGANTYRLPPASPLS